MCQPIISLFALIISYALQSLEELPQLHVVWRRYTPALPLETGLTTIWLPVTPVKTSEGSFHLGVLKR
jgi:hypothetical protein